MRKPSFKASNNSVTSRTCLTSSRDSINMVLFPFPLSLLNPFDHARRDVGGLLNPYDVHTLQRIHDEIRYQTEFVILPFSRCNFEGLVENRFSITREIIGERLDIILFEAGDRSLPDERNL